MTLTINSFLGANLALDPKLLPDSVGVISLNQKPGRGDLRAWNEPLTVSTIATSPQRLTIYRMGQDVVSDSNYWLGLTTIAHFVREALATDTTERTFYTGSGTPKWTDNIIGLASAPYPTAFRELGVPAPLSPLMVFQSAAGTGTDESWAYVHTFLNDLGWESAPSPSSAAIIAKPGAIIDLSSLESAPAGAYGITARRIYKLKAGTSGNSEFFFLREVSIGTTSTTDDARALGTVLATGALGTVGSSWLPAPADGKGLTEMWNGMLAMISGKSVRICEPYHPYAWPLKYEIPTTHPPVALATFDQTLLALTTGDVIVVVGSDPAGADDNPAKLFKPCASPRAVVSFRDGATWATPDEQYWYGAGGQHRSLTKHLIEPEVWATMNPSTMVATRYRGLLIVFYDNGGGVLKGFAIDPMQPDGLYQLDTGYHAVHRDPITDAIYVLEGGVIKKWNAGAALLTATFKSKVYKQPAPVNFTAAQVIASAYPVPLKVWSNGVLRLDRSITSVSPVRLIDGNTADEWQVEGSTSVGSVQAVRLAASMRDFKEP